MGAYPALGFEQLHRFLCEVANDDIDELLAFFAHDEVNEWYYRAIPDKRQRFVEAMGHTIRLAYHGNLALANRDLEDDIAQWNERTGLVPRPQRTRLMHEAALMRREANRGYYRGRWE
ncbi:MAG: hypothetical protein ACOYBJ_00265 [Patescibacteria group bacterium]